MDNHESDSSVGADPTIDLLNGLSLLVQMLMPVGIAHGVCFAGPLIFFLSPAEPVGVLALVGASFLRRAQVRNTILVEIFGTICVIAASVTLIWGWADFRGLFFLTPVVAKIIYLVAERVRGRTWTQVSGAGIMLFVAACWAMAVLIIWRLTS
jgi:hypothetical protein